MDKQKIIAKVIEHFEKELFNLREAARATYEAAINEESRPENEYDTRGLEASYLAGAQAKRVAEVEEMIFILKELKPRAFHDEDKISVTALVEVEANKKRNFVLIMPKGGGTTLTIDGVKFQIVTPVSPIGEALIGLSVGDFAVVESGQASKEYEIISVQ